MTEQMQLTGWEERKQEALPQWRSDSLNRTRIG